MIRFMAIIEVKTGTDLENEELNEKIRRKPAVALQLTEMLNEAIEDAQTNTAPWSKLFWGGRLNRKSSTLNIKQSEMNSRKSSEQNIRKNAMKEEERKENDERSIRNQDFKSLRQQCNITMRNKCRSREDKLVKQNASRQNTMGK